MRVLATCAAAALARIGAAVPGRELVPHPCDSLGRLRAEQPDVLVLLTPVLWPGRVVSGPATGNSPESSAGVAGRVRSVPGSVRAACREVPINQTRPVADGTGPGNVAPPAGVAGGPTRDARIP